MAKTKLPKAQLLPSGKYRVRVVVNGQRVSVTADDEKTAQAKAIALQAGIAKQEEKKNSQTVKDAISEYIESRENILSPATIRSYKVIQRDYFKNIMHRKVSDITEKDLQKEINALSKDHAYKTTKNAISFLASVVSQDHDISTRRLTYQQNIQKEHAYLDGNEMARLIDAIKGDIIEIPVLLALWLGMRRSEICALVWSDFDFDKKTVSITKALVPNSENKYVVKNTTKTEKSRRVVSCPDYIIERMKSIFPDGCKGRIVKMNPNDIYNHLKVICNSNNIRFVGIHGLRHTNASVMLSLGIADKIAMARGGWSSKDTMQNIYQHIFSTDSSAADVAINNYFGNLLGLKLDTKMDTKK